MNERTPGVNAGGPSSVLTGSAIGTGEKAASGILLH